MPNPPISFTFVGARAEIVLRLAAGTELGGRWAEPQQHVQPVLVQVLVQV